MKKTFTLILSLFITLQSYALSSYSADYKLYAKTKLGSMHIGIAQFVDCVATGGSESVIVKDSGGTTLGNLYLHAAGDTIIVEKAPTDTITLANGHASAVGSPRS